MTTSKAAGQAYALFGVTLLLVLTGGVAIQSALPRIGLAITEVALILGPAVIVARRKGLPAAVAFRWRAIPIVTAAVSLGVGVSAWAIAIWMHRVVSMAIGKAPAVAALTAASPAELTGVLVVAAVLPAVCEEALFRGVIQGILERRGRPRAVAITAVLFGIFHLDPWTALPAVFLGLVFGALVVRTGSTVTSTIAHSANNATAVTVGFVLRGRSDASADVLLAVLTVAFLALVPIFWRVTRETAVTSSPLAAVPAGLTRSRGWWARALIVTAATLVILIAVAVVRITDVRRVETTTLEPSLHRGERAILVRVTQAQRERLTNGVIVSYQQAGEVKLGRLMSGDRERVQISAEAGPVEVMRSEIVGVVVYPMSARHLPKTGS